MAAACSAAFLVAGATVQAEPIALPGREATAPAASAAHVAAQARWKSALDAFAAADKAALPASNGVLFVGSSSIRLWNSLARDFRELPVVINRGFGGSTMADCSLFAHELVVRYKPSHVLVYAGDNDLAVGRMPMDVLKDLAQFVQTVRDALPETRISYISIKPSPSREALLPRTRETNNIVSAYLRTQANADYIDIFTPMIGPDGRPRGELFLPDRLHMNSAGYKLWHEVISAHLPPSATPVTDARTLYPATAPPLAADDPLQRP